MTKAQEFQAFMDEVWADTTEPTPDGGLIAYFSPLYDEWHNARVTAKLRFNATRGTAHRHHEIPGYGYAFPDGSRAWIATDGSAVKAIRERVDA